MKLNEVIILPSVSFVVEIIEDGVRNYILRTPNGAPVATFATVAEVAQYFSNLDLSQDK